MDRPKLLNTITVDAEVRGLLRAHLGVLLLRLAAFVLGCRFVDTSADVADSD